VSAVPQEDNVIEPSTQAGETPSSATDEPSTAARFHIFIVDSGWNSAAHRVLVENFALIRNLQKDDPIYVLSREQSIEFQRHHGSRIGRDPIIAVHDMDALDKGGASGFHGFRLSLGLAHPPTGAHGAAGVRPLPRNAPPLHGSRGGHPRQPSPRGALGSDRDHPAS
jgi:hypothetical protein